jgi:hypothetical protein
MISALCGNKEPLLSSSHLLRHVNRHLSLREKGDRNVNLRDACTELGTDATRSLKPVPGQVRATCAFGPLPSSFDDSLSNLKSQLGRRNEPYVFRLETLLQGLALDRRQKLGKSPDGNGKAGSERADREISFEVHERV